MNIVTHSGRFHADEVFAVAILELSVNGVAYVRRTRDDAEIAAAKSNRNTYVLDVGGEYDPVRENYDHHQWRSDNAEGEIRANGIPYATAGLVWRNLAERVFSRQTPALLDVKEFYTAVDDALIAGIDAADTGYFWSKELPYTNAVPMSMSLAISAFNPTGSGKETDGPFADAVAWARQILKRTVHQSYDKLETQKVIRRRIEVHLAEIKADCLNLNMTRPAILVLDEGGSWIDVILSDPRYAILQYVIYPDDVTGWMVQCVPKSKNTPDKRKALPAFWAGARDIAFQAKTGVGDAVFCHPARFLCGARTFEGAMALACAAVDNTDLD